MHENAHKQASSSILFGIGLFLLGLILFVFPPHALSAGGTPLTGYGWSDNIGWISFNCSNTSSCGTSDYGFVVDPGGNMSGYAWSDNIGWISANNADTAGCPTAPCSAKISPADGSMSGWLKAIGNGGGWDGWISLSGPGYGPILGSGGTFSGYAWGSTVVGWVDLQYARTAFLCIPSINPATCTADRTGLDNGCAITTCTFPPPTYGCDAGVVPNACKTPPAPTGSITTSPRIVRSGQTVQVLWNVTNANAASCLVTGSNGDSWAGRASSLPSGQVSGPITSQTIYTLHCNGQFIGTFNAQTTVNIAPTFNEK